MTTPDEVKAEAVKAWARKIRHEIAWAGATIPWLESALSLMWQEAFDAGRLRETTRGQHDNS